MVGLAWLSMETEIALLLHSSQQQTKKRQSFIKKKIKGKKKKKWQNRVGLDASCEREPYFTSLSILRDCSTAADHDIRLYVLQVRSNSKCKTVHFAG